MRDHFLLSAQRYKCWTTFPINKGFSENFTSVQNLGEEFDIFIETTLQKFVTEIICKTNTDQELLHCYLSEFGPFHWGTASGVFGRICEIAYLCCATNSDRTAANRCIERQFKYLKSDMYGCFADQDVFEKILLSF